jgi:hypothetical protein
MSRTRDLRFLTIAAVIALSLWTAWRGALAAAYEFAVLRSKTQGEGAAVSGHWTNERGVASLALVNQMRVAPDFGEPAQIQARRDMLAAFLGHVPLSSQRWLELAVMRNASGQAAEKITEALAMSSLTGPNEASIILRRAAFALSIWEKLDPETRGRAANDLAVIIPPLDPGGIKLALAIKTDKVRSEVRDTLAARGVAPSVVKYIGL